MRLFSKSIIINMMIVGVCMSMEHSLGGMLPIDGGGNASIASASSDTTEASRASSFHREDGESPGRSPKRIVAHNTTRVAKPKKTKRFSRMVADVDQVTVVGTDNFVDREKLFGRKQFSPHLTLDQDKAMLVARSSAGVPHKSVKKLRGEALQRHLDSKYIIGASRIEPPAPREPQGQPNLFNFVANFALPVIGLCYYCGSQ